MGWAGWEGGMGMVSYPFLFDLVLFVPFRLCSLQFRAVSYVMRHILFVSSTNPSSSRSLSSGHNRANIASRSPAPIAPLPLPLSSRLATFSISDLFASTCAYVV